MDKIIRDIRTLLESHENYYEPVFSSNYIEYESNGDKDKALSIKEYTDEIRSYLRNMMNDLKIGKFN